MYGHCYSQSRIVIEFTKTDGIQVQRSTFIQCSYYWQKINKVSFVNFYGTLLVPWRHSWPRYSRFVRDTWTYPIRRHQWLLPQGTTEAHLSISHQRVPTYIQCHLGGAIKRNCTDLANFHAFVPVNPQSRVSHVHLKGTTKRPHPSSPLHIKTAQPSLPSSPVLTHLQININ